MFTPTRDRALLLTWIIAGTLLVLVLLKLFTRVWMVDAQTFHDVWRVSPMYDLPPGTQGAYLYSPAFAQMIWPLTHLPWWAFATLWLIAACTAYTWLVAPVGWPWAIPLLALAVEDITIGNTFWLLALGCVLGMRWPALWVVSLLTKITTGVGVVWFLARRDWRSLAWIGGALAGITILSAIIAPTLWQEWFQFLWVHRSQDPLLVVRVAGALGLVWYGAKTDRAWLIPVAMYLATPVLMVYGLGLLAAIPRLLSPAVQARARQPFGPPRAFLRRVLDLPPDESRTARVVAGKAAMNEAAQLSRFDHERVGRQRSEARSALPVPRS